MIVSLYVGSGFIGSTVGTHNLNIHGIHILAVVLVSDLSGKRIDDWAEQEVVDIITTLATGTIRGEVALSHVWGLRLRVNGLILIKHNADIITSRVDGGHQILSGTEVAVFVNTGQENVKSAHARVTVRGKVELLIVAFGGEHLLSGRVHIFAQVFDIGEFCGFFRARGHIDIIAAFATRHVGSEEDGQLVIADERMHIVVGGVSQEHQFRFAPGVTLFEGFVDIASLHLLLVLRTFGEIEHRTFAVTAGFTLVHIRVEDTTLVV